MSATNHTTNYNLPQFIGTDKPTWLTDVNGAMSTIDTQMKANADSATTAGTNATTAINSIGTLSSLTTTEKSNLVGAINEVKTEAGTAQNTANGAGALATSANDKVNTLASEFNLTPVGTYDETDLVVLNTGVTASFLEANVSIVKNASGSLAKIYGLIRLANTNSDGECYIRVVADSGLRPTEDINIYASGIDVLRGNSAVALPTTVIIKTTGEVIVKFYKVGNFAQDISLINSLLFITQFGDSGDTPSPNS